VLPGLTWHAVFNPMDIADGEPGLWDFGSDGRGRIMEIRMEGDLKRTTWRLSALALMAILSSACSSSGNNSNPPPPTPKVTVSPGTATVTTGGTRQFTATVSGSTDQNISWRVNGAPGGSSTYGLISVEGVFIAPTTVPNPASVTITAKAFSDPTKTGSATVTIQAGSSVRVIIAGAGSRLTVLTFGTLQYSAVVTGTSNTALTWRVNGTAGGSAAAGTITTTGLYYSPHSAPVSTSPNYEDKTTEVIVTAVSQADATASDSAIVVPTPIQQAHFPAPVLLGTSGGNSLDLSTSSGTTFCCSGTIGSLVSRGGKLYILSNNHVLARNDLAAVGEDIIQPGLVGNNCRAAGTVTAGNLSQYFNLENDPRPNVDAALAEIVSGAVDPLGTIAQLGGTAVGGQPTDGTPNPGPGVTPTIARPVAKSGAATGLTCGNVLAINASISVEYQKGCNTGSNFTCDFTNQITIAGAAFSAEGDSGSLIVTQDTADPVGLLFAGSSSDTVATPVAVVEQQLADKDTGEQFVFAGDGAVGPHPMAACSIAQPATAQAFGLQGFVLPAEDLRAVTATRDAHAAELLGQSGVLAVGVGLSYDHPGEPAILLFVAKRAAHGNLAPSVDGIPVRIVEVEAIRSGGLLSAEDSEQAEQAGEGPLFVSPVSQAEVERARNVHREWVAGLMRQRGVQGVGISSSADAPGEAALIVFVIKGVPRDPIPLVLDGLRTRVRETGRFRAR
jgi:hypothetical protein